MNTFEQDLEEAVAYHGHLCSGQIIGVRMARMALRLLGIVNPKASHDLIVYVECDRCLSDAIGTVTGCKLGRRTLKWMDYGKSAATFLDMRTGKAIRIFSKKRIHAPDDADLVKYFETISDDDIFGAVSVEVLYTPDDMPGKPKNASLTCPVCGETISDGRYVTHNGVDMCKPCAYGAYYITINS